MTESNEGQGQENGGQENGSGNANTQTQNPPPAPTPPPQNNSGTSPENGDLAAVYTAINALPERIAHVIRESMPRPPANPPQRRQESNDSQSSDNGNGSNRGNSNSARGADSQVPGKPPVRHTLFGIPWD